MDPDRRASLAARVLSIDHRQLSPECSRARLDFRDDPSHAPRHAPYERVASRCSPATDSALSRLEARDGSSRRSGHIQRTTSPPTARHRSPTTPSLRAPLPRGGRAHYLRRYTYFTGPLCTHYSHLWADFAPAEGVSHTYYFDEFRRRDARTQAFLHRPRAGFPGYVRRVGHHGVRGAGADTSPGGARAPRPTARRPRRRGRLLMLRPTSAARAARDEGHVRRRITVATPSPTPQPTNGWRPD